MNLDPDETDEEDDGAKIHAKESSRTVPQESVTTAPPAEDNKESRVSEPAPPPPPAVCILFKNKLYVSTTK